MKNILHSLMPFFVCTLQLGSSEASSTATPEVRLLVSVSNISGVAVHDDALKIFYTVHQPETLTGSLFVVLLPFRDRAAIRKERPLGSLHTLSVTSTFAGTLKEQSTAREKEQTQIDAGIDPRKLSSAILLPNLEEKDIVVDFDEFTFLPIDGAQSNADVSYISLGGDPKMKLNPGLTDFVRENLIHIFDSANFHQMEGSALTVKSQEKVQQQLDNVRSGSYLELNLDEPARLVVEETVLSAEKMWVSIRESDGFVYDWILERPDGALVSLNKTRGELIVLFAPHVLYLLEHISKPDSGETGQ
ncbi:MAG: hypothetical protein PF795_07210 [Kiritimatiellae bacterium]|jgi:hypothetical protein|nr:hypothetical protein [Kiritimatiellia bacterium]